MLGQLRLPLRLPPNLLRHCKQRRASILIAALLIGAVYFSGVHFSSVDSVHGDTSATSNLSLSGVTGKLFSGVVVRNFPMSSLLLAGKREKKARLAARVGMPQCSKWAVVTTIHAPGEAVMDLANGRDGWCLVVVGDEGTPPYVLPRSHGFFLDAAAQRALESDYSGFLRLLPWRHFGRKNAGFLFAILHGATSVWDFDDDNGRRRDSKLEPPTTARLVIDASEENLNPTASGEKPLVQLPCMALNPYPLMGAPTKPSWPRGFPLNLIKLPCSIKLAPATAETAASVGVFQSLANHEPDVDGIFRLTLPIPFDWDEVAQDTLVLPAGIVAPYNAQAQLSMHGALWALLLPVTVHGRVSDIWRSYFAQRLLWDVGLRIAFTPPRVTQIRNPHNALADMHAEKDLYEKSLALVEFLRKWRGTGATLQSRFEELHVALYERSYIEIVDVLLAQQWILALESAGYDFPALKANAGAWK